MASAVTRDDTDGFRHVRPNSAKPVARGCEPVEQALLREAVHLDEPVHRCAGAPERIRAVMLASDGNHSAIERRRRAPVEANLRLAKRAAELGR